MNLKRLILIAALPLCLSASGCISFEQEIFLNADGSSQMVLFMSLPDFQSVMPAGALSKQTGQAAAQDPEEILAKAKAEAREKLPPGATLKDIREVRQNGMLSLYVVFDFKDLKSLEEFLKAFYSEVYGQRRDSFSIQLERVEGRTTFTCKFSPDAEAFFGAPKKPTAETEKPRTIPRRQQRRTGQAQAPKGAAEIEGLTQFEEQMDQLLALMFRFRFRLHAPAPITETNANIVLNERIAVWDLSLATSSKDKGPFQMTVSY